MSVQRNFTRNVFNNLDPTLDQGSDLNGIVRKKANPTDAEITQNRDWEDTQKLTGRTYRLSDLRESLFW